MKILKIFSMVLALHLVLLVVFLVSPGCQSRPSPVPEGPAVAPVADENWSNQGAGGQSSLDPVPVAGGGTYANQPLLGQTPADRARATPTRPSGADRTPTSSSEQVEEVLMPETGTPASASPVKPALITYSIRRGDSLWSISRQFGVTIQDIVAANPGITPNSIQYGEKIMVPDRMSRGGAASGAASSVQTQLPDGASTYTVKSGDYLARIASQNGTTVGAIRTANNLTSDLIQVGQVLIIPAGSSREADATGVPADAVTITVQPGDTIGAIARNYDVTVRELMDANRITDPRKLRVGQKLIIPGFKSVDASRASVTVSPSPDRSQPSPQGSPAPRTGGEPAAATEEEPEASPVIPVGNEPSPDLDDLLSGEDLPAPVIPIDEPVAEP